jgi:membrane protein implicated in regulation of membrane protease activity
MEVRMIVFLLILIILILVLGPPGALLLIGMPVAYFVFLGLDKMGVDSFWGIMGLFVIFIVIGGWLNHRFPPKNPEEEEEEIRRLYLAAMKEAEEEGATERGVEIRRLYLTAMKEVEEAKTAK